MRYAAVIVGPAFLFAAVGLLGAWGAAEYAYGDVPPVSAGDRETILFTFIGVPLSGFIAGCVIGLVAAFAVSRADRRP